jgi:hypothetical protein
MSRLKGSGDGEGKIPGIWKGFLYILLNNTVYNVWIRLESKIFLA